MLIKRKDALEVQNFFELIKDKKFNISTQYKLIKLKKALQEEQEIYQEQIRLNCLEYFETQGGRPIINSNGGYKIKEDKINQCYAVIEQINECQAQLPDIYFSLDELEELQLNFEDLELISPFIKL